MRPLVAWRLAGGSLLAAALLMPGSGMVRSASVASIPSPPAPAQADVCRSILPHAYDARAGLPRHAARPVPLDARCPVCGMFPARAPRWAAQLIFDDGAAYFFDSPVSLLLYLQDVGRYSRARTHTEVRASYVQDFGTGTWLPLDSAWFVHDSDVLGPMRAGNLPPFGTRADAEAFARRHGGEVYSAAQLQRALPEALRRLAPHRHDGGPTGR